MPPALRGDVEQRGIRVALVAVVVAARRGTDLVVDDLVDESVLVGDASRPVAVEAVLEGFGLADAVVAGARDVLEQRVGARCWGGAPAPIASPRPAAPGDGMEFSPAARAPAGAGSSNVRGWVDRPSPGLPLDGLIHGRLPVYVGVDRGRELGRRGVVTGERDDEARARAGLLIELVGDGGRPATT